MPTTRVSLENAQYLPDREDSAVNLPPEVFTTLQNFRLRDGVARRSRGSLDVIEEALPSGSTLSTLIGDPHFTTNINFSDQAEVVYLGVGLGNRFYKVNSDSTEGLSVNLLSLAGSPAAFSGDPYEWTRFYWGSVTVLHNPAHGPIYVTPGSTNLDMSLVPGWDTNDRTDHMFPLSNFIVGLGFHGATPGGASIDSRRIIITSDQITAFNEFGGWELGNDASSSSNFYLVDGIIDGDLITGGQLNDHAVAYSDVGSLRINPLDDGTLEIFPLFADDGVLSKNSWCNIPDAHFVIGNHQVYTHDGNSKTVLGQDQWSETFFARIAKDRLREVQCLYEPRENSVWMVIPTGTTDKEVWIVSLDTGLIEEVKTGEGININNWFWYSSEGLPLPSLTVYTDEFYEEGRAFRSRIMGAGNETGGGVENTFFVHGIGDTYGDQTIDGVLSRETFIGAEGYSKQTVSRITPLFEGTGDLQIRVGGHDDLSADTTWTNTRTLTAGSDRKMDSRVTRSYLSIEFSTEDDITIAGYEAFLSEKYGKGRR